MAAQILTWLILGVCLALSFLLSGMEAGVFALIRLRVRQQMRAGQPSAKLLHGFLENPENFLWTILVGNTLVNFAILGWVVATLHGYLAGPVMPPVSGPATGWSFAERALAACPGFSSLSGAGGA